MIIRNPVLSDLPYLYAICHQTGYNGRDASPFVGDPFLLGQLFVAPYVIHSPTWCWVILNEGVPAGYFVSTPDSKSFYEWMEQIWAPPLREYYQNSGKNLHSEFETTMRGMIHAKHQAPALASEFPAHIHMDLLPGLQKQGLGTKLFSLFHQRMKDFNIPGTHIGVSADNPGAMIFYQKQGYAKTQIEDWGVYMCRKL